MKSEHDVPVDPVPTAAATCPRCGCDLPGPDVDCPDPCDCHTRVTPASTPGPEASEERPFPPPGTPLESAFRHVAQGRIAGHSGIPVLGPQPAPARGGDQ